MTLEDYRNWLLERIADHPPKQDKWYDKTNYATRNAYQLCLGTFLTMVEKKKEDKL